MPRADSRAAGGGRNARRRAREFALQGLYQWLLAQAAPTDILWHLREQEEYEQADGAFVEHLVLGATGGAEELSDWMQPFLDRPIKALSPVERAILLLGAFELRTAPEAGYGAPYRVVINEAVELAKRFGGTDGHKYVNGVLDKLASTVRGEELAPEPRPGRRAAGRRKATGGGSADAATIDLPAGENVTLSVKPSVKPNVTPSVTTNVSRSRATPSDSE